MAGRHGRGPLVLATAVRDLSQVLLMAPIGTGVDGAVLAWLLLERRRENPRRHGLWGDGYA